MDVIELRGGLAWIIGLKVVAVLEDVVIVKRFNERQFKEHALDALRAGDDPRYAIGVLQRSIPYSDLTSVTFVEKTGDLTIRGHGKSMMRVTTVPSHIGHHILEELHARTASHRPIRSATAMMSDLSDRPSMLINGLIVGGSLLSLLAGAYFSADSIPSDAANHIFRQIWLFSIMFVIGHAVSAPWANFLAVVAIVVCVIRFTWWYETIPNRRWFEVRGG